MSHAEHLGTAFANIVYAFLITIDTEDYDAFICRMFERESREKRTLIAFLMKKRAVYCSLLNNVVEKEEGAEGEGSRLADSWNQDSERRSFRFPQEKPDAPVVGSLERNMAINDVVSQLTIVRNAFLENILKIPGTVPSGRPSAIHRSLQQIPNVSLNTLVEGVTKTIMDVVLSLCNKIEQRYSSSLFSRPIVVSDRSVRSDCTGQGDCTLIQMLSSAVEIIWAYSLYFILASKDVVHLRSGGFVQCSRFLLCDLSMNSVGETTSSRPSLCDLPPVFFLSFDLAMKLEEHFHGILTSGNVLSTPSGMHLLLLSCSCYELLTQVDETLTEDVWRGMINTCASVMKLTLRSSQDWEDVDWSNLIHEADPSHSTADHGCLVQDLIFIWRRQHGWWGTSMDDKSHVADNLRANSLPIFLREYPSSFFSSRFKETIAIVLDVCGLSKTSNGGKNERTIGDIFNGLYRCMMHLCYIFNHRVATHALLNDLLDLLRKILLLSKKERRLKELVTIVLSLCLLPQSFPHGSAYSDTQQQQCVCTEKVVESLLDEIDNWRKAKNAICYALSMAALLSRCSLKELERRLPLFFATMESWFASANNMERIAILHSTLHAGGLLCDVCANNDSASPYKWNDSISNFFHSVEKMLLNGIGSKPLKNAPFSSSCIEIASDLLVFTLQQEPFQSSALHWLARLMETKAKSRTLSKSGISAVVTRGRLIAIRTIWALFELYYCGSHSLVRHGGLAAKDIFLACSHTSENRKRLCALYNTPLDQKGSIKETIIGFIALHGTCYRPVVATVEALAIFWRGGHLKNVINFVRTSEETRQGITELREAAFHYAGQIHKNGYSEENMEYAHQLVPIFLIARFWDPPQVLLEYNLALPMLLVGPKTPLYDAVSNIVFPFYFLKRNEKGMWSCALALHRLVECIIVLLGNDEDDRVAHLAEYVALNLMNLRDRMESLVNEELCAVKPEENGVAGFPFSKNSYDKESYHKKLVSCRSKWAWLLNVLDMSPLIPKESLSSTDSQNWCAVPAVRNAALVDLLEGLAVVLLGHSKLQVRRNALFLLELVSSLLRLQRIHCGATSQVTDSSLLDDNHYNAHNPMPSTLKASRPSVGAEEPRYPRVAVADIFEELGEQFDEMYASNKERYVPLVHVFEGRSPSLAGSINDKLTEDAKHRVSRDAWPKPSFYHKVLDCLHPSTIGRESTLTATSFGVHCLSDDGTTPHFVFVSTTALALLMYGYCPGSVLVRVVCAIAGEIVERGVKRYIERSSPVWRSCYALNFLLLCVDNVKSSPDANRLTRGGERNRPGHQQGGNSTFVGGTDDLKDVDWQIVNRYAAYQNLMNVVTVPLLLNEINTENIPPCFLDMMQYLLLGPMECVATGNTSLVTYSGVMDSDHPIITAMHDILAVGRSKTRGGKQAIFHTCYVVLLPMILVISRRYFVKPPFVPGWKQNTVATQRARMETVLQGVIDSLLLGDSNGKEYAGEHDNEHGLSAESLSRMLYEGNGVSVRSCLSLQSLPSVIAQSEGKPTSNGDTLNEVKLTVFLRGVLCDVIALVYSKDAKFLEPQMKSKFLTKVLYSLKYQVLWFLQGNASYPGKGFGQKLPKNMNAGMEKSILALQTVVSSLVQPTLQRNQLEHAFAIINTFGIKFFQWLQESLPTDCKNLETYAPSVFGLAVTLLVADSPLRDSVFCLLCKLPLGSPVHRNFFSVIVTACSSMWDGRKGPLLSQKYCGKATSSFARSVASYDAPLSSLSNTWRNDCATLELKNMGSVIYYALAYLYRDETFGYFFDSTVRSKAYDLLVLLCGEAPAEPMADPLDDWLCLLLKACRQGGGEVESDNRLVQSLFVMASEDILSVGRKSSSAIERQRIALSLLSFFLRRVRPTESNLRTVLRVTQACRNTSSELALATLWGGWIAYEGRERERFTSLLVLSSMDLADKRVVTQYIDIYINHEMAMRGKGQDGKLDGRSRGAYYGFLLFSLYQMRLLRHIVSHNDDKSKANLEPLGEATLNNMQQSDWGWQSLIAWSSFSPGSLDSQANRKMELNVKLKSKFLWIINENIWRISLKLTNENLKKNFGVHSFGETPTEIGMGRESGKFVEDSAMLQELGFVKPLLSVLFFASWAIRRLQQRDWRLWKELHRDLSSITGLTMRDSATDLKPVVTPNMFLSSSEDQTTSESETDDSAEHLGSVAERNTHSDYQTSSTWEEHKVDNTMADRDEDGDEEEQEREGNAEVEAGHHSEESSVGTVVVNADAPKVSVTEVIASNMKQAAKLKREEKLKRASRINDPLRLLQRDFVALFLHFTCLLLVHMGFGEMRCREESDELSSRFHVLETAFEVLGILLKETASEGICRSSSSLKSWLKVTFARLKRCEAMKRDSKNFNDTGSSLTFEPSLFFGGNAFDVGLSDSPSSSVELVLKELFFNITGQGRNVRGRHFLLRCLHEFSTWLQHNSYEESEVKVRLHKLHSYISLLSLKVARVISFCLSCTTGVLVVGRDCQHKWMEKTAMQLAGESAFRRFLNALLHQTNALQNDSSSSLKEPFVRAQGYAFRTSVLRSLACLLSDIIIHEIYYCTGTLTKEVEERKQDALLLSTPFGDNSSFPAHNLLTSFWTGFAFLLDSNTWQAACDLLAVFHRYGCAEFLGTISSLPFSSLYSLGLNIAPDLAAVQLVFLHQGKELTTSRNVWRHAAFSEEEDHSLDHAVDVVLNYLNEYAGEKEEPAVFLAFTELLLLCDWKSLDYEKYAPKFTAFTKTEASGDPQYQQYRVLSTQRDACPPRSSVFRPFSSYVCYFAESWKRGLLLLSPGSEMTSEGLSSRIMFVLGEFFQIALKVFGVSSVDVLLRRVIGGNAWKRGSVGMTSSCSKSHHTDLCSLHSCVDLARESHKLTEEHVSLFQHKFETIVFAPLIFLFQSPETPLPLWSKILSLVAALLRYHEQNHGFVTDQLLKFLPDIERGLGVGTAYNSFTDETPLKDRLVVLVLADEVSSKVKSLRLAAWTKMPCPSPFDSGNGVSLLASLLDNHSVLKTLLDKLANDPFSAQSIANVGKNAPTEFVGDRTTSTVSSHTEEWELRHVQNVSKWSHEGSDSEDVKAFHPMATPRPAANHPDEGDLSSLIIQRVQSHTTVSTSRRFGGYVYETLTGANDVVQLIGQLPLEYYSVAPKGTPSTSPVAAAERAMDLEQPSTTAEKTHSKKDFVPLGVTMMLASSTSTTAVTSLSNSTENSSASSDDDSAAFFT
ncbi:hypothetical protein TCSYLVIO_004130 [Trypanosoma cruzi]|nr:hypothetical protein TCSYLVIO_004130 [Trypanosoma cruzi]